MDNQFLSSTHQKKNQRRRSAGSAERWGARLHLTARMAGARARTRSARRTRIPRMTLVAADPARVPRTGRIARTRTHRAPAAAHRGQRAAGDRRRAHRIAAAARRHARRTGSRARRRTGAGTRAGLRRAGGDARARRRDRFRTAAVRTRAGTGTRTRAVARTAGTAVGRARTLAGARVPGARTAAGIARLAAGWTAALGRLAARTARIQGVADTECSTKYTAKQNEYSTQTVS